MILDNLFKNLIYDPVSVLGILVFYIWIFDKICKIYAFFNQKKTKKTKSSISTVWTKHYEIQKNKKRISNYQKNLEETQLQHNSEKETQNMSNKKQKTHTRTHPEKRKKKTISKSTPKKKKEKEK